jgi:RNA polymerase sigma factor (sigma-70 family)
MVNQQLPLPAVAPSRDCLSLVEHLSDGQLLERFVRTGDGAAFTALVRRHGPLVLGVCRRVLGNSHDAEDAFQATFLVLVRKAASLSRPELLAGWLHGVAYRTAQHARARAARRSQREREAAMSEARNDPQQVLPEELRQLLDRELAALPEKYRAPLVLCYLEGKTNEQAARLLGWPTGSMSYRLARGREMLRERLIRGHQALAAALPALLFTDVLESPILPPLLAHATVQAALALLAPKAAATGLISTSVQELMEATLRSLAGSGRRGLTTLLLSLLLFSALSSIVYGTVQQMPSSPGSTEAACPPKVKHKTQTTAARPAPQLQP